MKLGYSVYCRRPLGRLLSDFVDVVSASALIDVAGLVLLSRGARTDLAREDVFASAAKTKSDSCTVRTSRGAIDLRWSYGPRASNQTIHGVVKASERELDEVLEMMTAIATWSRAVYAFCDLWAVIDKDIAARGGSLQPTTALYGIYWYNYFGPEYAASLNTESLRQCDGVSLETSKAGTPVVLVESPGHTESAARCVAARWPLFEKYSPEASLPPVEIDYSEVRVLPPAKSEVESIGAIVGPADGFVSQVEQHSERFWNWAQSQSLNPRNEREFLRTLQQYESIIDDDPGLLVGAIAAYGELVRKNMNGVWTTAAFLHRGEPVVAKRGRPWTARRVIFEVLTGLENGGSA